MSDQSTPAGPKTTSRAAGIRHALFSAALWVTFAVYWNIVLGREVGREARFTVLLLALFVVLQVALTIAWVAHNRRLARRFAGRRTRHPRTVSIASHDFLGRRAESVPPDCDLTAAPVIRVRIDGTVKRFEMAFVPGEARAAAGE